MRKQIWAWMLWVGLWCGGVSEGLAQTEASSRLAAPSSGRQAAASLAELARGARGLYAQKRSFEGMDEAILARSGAAPAGLVKWGQLRNPAGEGFLSVRPVSLPNRAPWSSAEIVVPMIERRLCVAFLTELAMSPEFAAIAGAAQRLEPISTAGAGERGLEGSCEELSFAGARLLIHLR